jgi:hypothetical protein
VCPTLARRFGNDIASAALDLSPEFVPLKWQALIVFTAVLVSGGVLVFAVVARLATDALRLYRRIAFGVLVTSMIPDLLLPGRGPGATWPAALVLMVLHIAAWWATVAILTRWTVRSAHERAGPCMRDSRLPRGEASSWL